MQSDTAAATYGLRHPAVSGVPHASPTADDGLAVLARGTWFGPENVFEARFLFVDELNRMGSQIRVEGHHAVIRGVDRLTGAPVRVPDIRAGAALVLGGLCAQGRPVHDDGHIERGYEDFVEKLTGLERGPFRSRHRGPGRRAPVGRMAR